MKDKFINKYMRLAKLMGEDQNPCYSRQIGCIIVDPETNSISGTGYNGPPPETPHCDSEEYLREFFWPQLVGDERSLLGSDREKFIHQRAGCKICPRKLVGAKSGERSDLCSCGHAERHAITNAAKKLVGHHMFLWAHCGCCLQCTDAIIHAKISTVHHLIGSSYHQQAEWLFKKAGVIVQKYPEERFLCQ